MTKLLAGALGVATGLLFAAFALAAGSYTDAAGDDNAAPDVRSVSVSESPSGTLTVTVAVANYQTHEADFRNSHFAFSIPHSEIRNPKFFYPTMTPSSA